MCQHANIGTEKLTLLLLLLGGGGGSYYDYVDQRQAYSIYQALVSFEYGVLREGRSVKCCHILRLYWRLGGSWLYWGAGSFKTQFVLQEQNLLTVLVNHLFTIITFTIWSIIQYLTIILLHFSGTPCMLKNMMWQVQWMLDLEMLNIWDEIFEMWN